MFLAAFVAGGCGFFSDEEDEPLEGRYTSDEFRVQPLADERCPGAERAGAACDLAARGLQLRMTLAEGAVREAAFGQRGTPPDFGGTYERQGNRVTFDFEDGALVRDFGTGTPLRDVVWVFYEDDATLRADEEGYVLYLEKAGVSEDDQVD